jgi:hypothetical protein
MNRILSLLVSILGLAAIVIGVVFVFQGVSKNNMIVDRMRVEKVTLALDPNNPKELTQIKTGAEAQAAADTIATHRRAIAPSYQDLLNGGRFDPTNPQHLMYSQAMNLENYLYMAVTAFGLVQVVMAAGAFMVITGFALLIIGYLFFKNYKKVT